MRIASCVRLRRTAVAATAIATVVLAGGYVPSASASDSHAKHPKAVSSGSRYLALGDSVVFGYREPDARPAPDYSDPTQFVGFPRDVAANLHLRLTNASCPGETTASFMKTSAQSNGCENTFSPGNPPVPGGYRTLNPLHVKYKSAKQSQLAFAEAYLHKHPKTRLVTLMIGANDGFVCQQKYPDQCQSELAQLKKHITKRVGRILEALRKTAHYRGQLVMVTYYAEDYNDFLSTFESQQLNDALETAAQPYHVAIANGYRQFRLAAKNGGRNACTAGLLTRLTGADKGTCGVHPSVAGQALLAQAVERAVKS